MSKTQKLIILSLLISQALALHVIERAIPVPMAVPGIKLGLANIITLFTLIIFGFKEAIIVVVLRTFLGSLFGGGISSFLFSVVGGLMSTAIMAILYRYFINIFSISTISVVGAVFHNLGQIAVASLLVANANLFYYLPVLLISGIITGLFIGFTVQFAKDPLMRILRMAG